MAYRPEGWENPYSEHGAVLKEMGNEIAFEAGADAMLEAIWKLAEASPTKTFTFDADTDISCFKEAFTKEER